MTTTVIAITVATAQPKGSTRSTAKATGTAHHANDGATRVSAPQSTTIPLTQTVGHQERPGRRPRVAYARASSTAPASTATPIAPTP